MTVSLDRLVVLAEAAIAADDGIAPVLYRELPPVTVLALVRVAKAAEAYFTLSLADSDELVDHEHELLNALAVLTTGEETA